MGGNQLFVDGYGAAIQDVFDVGTVQHYPIGTRATLDSRSFRYARMVDTTAIGPNKLAQMCPPVANHVTETGTLSTVSNGVSTSAAQVGATRLSVVLGATAAYADEYRDGYLKIQSATTGAGQIFKLLGHAAVASAGTLTADIANPVVTATSGTTTWSLIHAPWADVVISPTTITAPAAGVTMVNWAASSTTAPKYGWLQTWGLASCLIDTSNQVAGSGMIQSGATAGALAVAVETDIKQRIAVCVETITTDDIYATVFLQIAP